MSPSRRDILRFSAAGLVARALPTGAVLAADNAAPTVEVFDEGKRAISHGGAMAICRTANTDVLTRAIFLIGHADGSGELVFQNGDDAPHGFLSRTAQSQIPIDECPEIAIELTPAVFQQVRAGLFGTLLPSA